MLHLSADRQFSCRHRQWSFIARRHSLVVSWIEYKHLFTDSAKPTAAPVGTVKRRLNRSTGDGASGERHIVSRTQRNVIHIRYSKLSGLEVEGRADELRLLRRQIMNLSSLGDGEIHPHVPRSSQSQYSATDVRRSARFTFPTVRRVTSL